MFRDWDETTRNWASPGTDGENLRFFDFPAYYLMGLAGLSRQDMQRNLEPFGLSMPEWRLLCTVGECSPARLSVIARLTNMDKAQVSRTLRSAQAKALVESHMLPVDPPASSNRLPPVAGRLHVSITPAGCSILHQIMPLVQRDQLRLLELMNAEERRIVIRVARRLFAQLGEETAAGSARGFRGDTEEPGAIARQGQVG